MWGGHKGRKEKSRKAVYRERAGGSAGRPCPEKIKRRRGLKKSFEGTRKGGNNN